MISTLWTEQSYVSKQCATTGITPIDTLKFMEPGLVKFSRRLVIKWHKDFKDGEFNVKKSPRMGRPGLKAT